MQPLPVRPHAVFFGPGKENGCMRKNEWSDETTVDDRKRGDRGGDRNQRRPPGARKPFRQMCEKHKAPLSDESVRPAVKKVNE